MGAAEKNQEKSIEKAELSKVCLLTMELFLEVYFLITKIPFTKACIYLNTANFKVQK